MPVYLFGLFLDFTKEGISIMEVDDVRRVKAANRKSAKDEYIRLKGFRKSQGWDEASQSFAGCPIVEIRK